MRVEQSMSLIVLLIYMLFHARRCSLLKIFSLGSFNAESTLTQPKDYFLKSISMIMSGVLLGLLVIHLSGSISDFYIFDLTVLALLLLTTVFTSIDLPFKRGREALCRQILLKLMLCLGYAVIFISLMFLYSTTSLSELISIQNSTFYFFPRWNVFIALPLAFVFVSNSLLLRDQLVNGSPRERYFDNLYFYFIDLITVFIFLVLFLGGFFSFGNIDELINSSLLLSIFQFFLSVKTPSPPSPSSPTQV